jgi:hypothetical protein
VIGEVLVAGTRTVRAVWIMVAAPTAVRVVVGWDRTAAPWAFAYGLGQVNVVAL